MDNQQLVKLSSGQIVGYPLTMRQIKNERRQSRLRRRAAFRKAKRENSGTKANPDMEYSKDGFRE